MVLWAAIGANRVVIRIGQALSAKINAGRLRPLARLRALFVEVETGSTKQSATKRLERKVKHPRRSQRALDDFAKGDRHATAGGIDDASRGRVAATQDHRAAAS